MTPEREKAARTQAEIEGGLIGIVEYDMRDSLRACLAEIDRLRALPVLATCGECGHRLFSFCDHPSLASIPKGRRGVDAQDAPPEWCPLRGAR